MNQRDGFGRRDFLMSVGCAAAAGALPVLGLAQEQPKKVDAAEPPKKTETRKPPPVGEGLHIGLIGCGGQGSGDAQNATRLGAKIVAVCDLDGAHLAEAKKKWPEAQTFHDFRDLLDRKEIDAVICGTPDHWHTFVAMAAMRAGKDVYCEKPLTLTIDEGKRLVKVQQETQRVLQTGTQQRSSTYFRMACELAQNGVVGKLRHISVYVPAGKREGPFKPSAIPSKFNYDMWLGQTPYVEYIAERTHLNFRYWWEYSAGTITDWGAHHNDIALWASGNERSGPVSVEAAPTIEPIAGGFTVPSEYQILFTYADGLTHSCQTTTADAWNGQVIDPKGQRHGVRFEGENGWIWVTRGTINANDRELLKHKFSSSEKRLYVSNDHMGNFLECVKTRKEPICPAEVGHRSASMCHLAAIAMRLGRKVEWDPQKEEFVGDAEAQKWVAREMRKPWDYGCVGA